MQDTTRPVMNGTGIDLSGTDPARAIFEATGGGYGTPRDFADPDPATLPAPARDGTWVAGDGRVPGGTDPAEGFDPRSLADPMRDIARTEDPVLPANPLLPMLQEPETPRFANGGPEGTSSWGWAAAGGAVVVGGVVAYLVSDSVKAWVDERAGEVKETVERLFVPDEAPPVEGKRFKPVTGEDLKKHDKAPDYYTNPDAETGPADDAAVLRQHFAGLLGGEGIGLALDTEAFLKGGSVLDALNGGKRAALADIMAGFDRFGIDARDGLTGEEISMLLDGLGLGGLADPMGFRPDLDRHAVLIDARSVEGLSTDTEAKILSLGHDPWW
ncbi:hypothetical protein GXW77_03395 [Roseomonas alkaliterrae]|uniref:Uncharacterized protein n=1 Tax=Neoroseomonas alkaliterrae TaxID=1452450 RepID=A0A840XTS4_9PROT|nr:hypothetical protein [Neoroseomonas alkaliterrae]MBB5690400.1 hypothetical protein [Neoroseomonas alkaliterrae]MBR0675214.1 hypothetical protein [Neoroseomonas alkaliterrae]